ncbi:MAG: alpha/beta hydrolase [Thermoleophilaceae bacterium]|nr:alpha/beta hydrolase [Thermoleophilaceae bacterium]
MRLALLAAIAASLVCAAPAAAIDRYIPMKAPPAPGPAKYDRIWMQQLGPADATQVLVLVPGTQGGAGGITPVARDIVRSVPRTQVWIVDRREQAFEDLSVFRHRDPDEALDYYLGFKYQAVRGEDARFVSEWGLTVQLHDLRSVVRGASAGGRRKVILGGHSAGASTAVAYAAWDFAGRPGYREIDGLVLIDGGLLASFDEASAARARRELKDIRSGKVFLDLLGLGLPEIAGIFAQVGALYAYERPDAPSTLQDFALLPAEFKPPVRVTNEALLGYAFDATDSPESLELIHVRAGRLADSGDPRPWQDGELTPIARFAKAYAANDPNATEWYYPRRLLLDIDAASDLRQNAAARIVGLRLKHGRDIDLPLYAFSTSLTKGSVAKGAHRLARMAPIPRKVIVDDRATSHLDPLSAAPRTNHFLKTVVPFLRRFAP